MNEPYGYSEFNDFDRFQNVDQIENLIVDHLIHSHTKHANNLWKILKYNDIHALSKPEVSEEDREALVCNENGDLTGKRVFFGPFVDDAWTEQCSSIYVFVESIRPINHVQSIVGVTVESIVHSKISPIAGDGDPTLNRQANPNDSDKEGNIVVSFKNRATVLLKCLLAELNGLTLNGIGYLQLNQNIDMGSQVTMPLFNSRAFYGHSSKFFMYMSISSDNPDETF